ncbi:MAG TPA: 4a-hydroxytetrahydrobiopterin dehydratase [Candidatus Baltobacteraceae bacterium]|nr:4a-hydroxytetrahydrobiopterin dehydratase [Candidatus Baltobacteraceae bacterium]
MKPFSGTHKTVSRARARNAALVNQLVTPGLGSLMCGRWLEGFGQIILSVAGCAMLLIWIFKIMGEYYGMMFEEASVKPEAWVGEAGGILFAASWLWSGLTSINLLREASNENLDSLKNLAAQPAQKLDATQIAIALASISNWKQTGEVISRTFQFKDFPAAIKFVNGVAEIAEAAWHHPDIDIRWNKVTLALTTHDAGGLTEKDFVLAKKFDELSLR